ncbi:translational activator of cytochrome c oxidase 1 [Rhinatrema bivittatum]|uniref:translational activator of cytochrome c oxidase 1 n=1 Tax=Rhinatrema bivittatum TaxID=194408 RepID=UPI00112B32BB|nr:translational activator of cytochrome c oxidase 1 [Rhinatrema bivittatum]
MAVATIFGRVKLQYKRSLLGSLLGIQMSSFRCTFPLDSCPLHSSFPCVQHAGLHLSSATAAGHNKWSKVKHIKGPKDDARARIFAKLAMMIKVAVREGGDNPNFNANLANLIEQCRSKNMPKASIEAAIKGVEKAKALSYALYEGRGPGGASLLIEILTDNTKRSYYEIKLLMSKNGGILCDSARHCFDKKGVVMVRGEDRENKVVELDHALELAIEAGAEDVKETEDEDEKTVLKFICDIHQLHEVRRKLDLLGLISLSAAPEFIPQTLVQLSDDEMAHASHLLHLIMDYQDVLRVYDNIE